METIEVMVVAIRDGGGNVSIVAYADPYDVVQVNMGDTRFEAEAYHLPRWCKDEGWKYSLEIHELPAPQ